MVRVHISMGCMYQRSWNNQSRSSKPPKCWPCIQKNNFLIWWIFSINHHISWIITTGGIEFTGFPSTNSLKASLHHLPTAPNPRSSTRFWTSKWPKKLFPAPNHNFSWTAPHERLVLGFLGCLLWWHAFCDFCWLRWKWLISAISLEFWKVLYLGLVSIYVVAIRFWHHKMDFL